MSKANNQKCDSRKFLNRFDNAKVGCRLGEARALRWEDIDWTHQIVTLHAAMDGEIYRPSTKERDVRTIPLTPKLASVLQSLTRNLVGFVFALNGKPLRKETVNASWRRAAKQVGIDVCCYQGTRHSIASQVANTAYPNSTPMAMQLS